MPQIPIFPPTREAQLLAWTTNWQTKITATPTAYGLTAGQATAYTTLHTAFTSAYATAINPETNSHSAIVAKNTAKQNLLNAAGGARQLVDIVQAFPGTTDEMRADLAIRIPDTDPTPVPVPTQAPHIDVVSTNAYTIKVRVHGDGITGKPPGVRGASLFTYVGATPPASFDAWMFQSNTTRNVIDLDVPTSTAGGSTVWITAFWFNPRMESGPATNPPVSVNIPGVLSEAA